MADTGWQNRRRQGNPRLAEYRRQVEEVKERQRAAQLASLVPNFSLNFLRAVNRGAGDLTAALVSGGLVEPAAGAAGVAATFGGMGRGWDERFEAGTNAIEGMREAYTAAPEPGSVGARGLERVVGLMQPVEQGLQAAGDFAFERGGPAAGAVAKTGATAMLQALPFAGPLARRAANAPRGPMAGSPQAQRGAVGDLSIRPEDYRRSSILDAQGVPIIKEGRPFSQRRPTAKGREGDFTASHLDLNFEDWATSSAGQAMAQQHLPNNPYLKIDKRFGTRGRLEQAIDQMMPRVQSFYDNAPAAVREQAQHWYPGYNNLANQIADAHRVPTEQGSAAIASFSPSTRWNANLEHAFRLDNTMRNLGGVEIDRAVRDKLTQGDFAKRFGRTARLDAARKAVLQARNVDQVLQSGDPLQIAVVHAALDDLYYPKTVGNWSPKGQLLGEEMVKKKGKKGGERPAVYVPNSLLANTNAIRALIGGYEDASAALGKAHKVRTFGLNGAVPSFPSAYTIDTHAAGAAYGGPLGSSHPMVEQTFGSKNAQGLNPADKGYSGSFPLIHEVYDRVAQPAVASGAIPRHNAMQSIPWEGKRSTMSSNEATLRAADAIWADYRKGRISNDRAMERLWEEVAK